MKEFTVFEDGKEIKLKIKSPTALDQREAERHYRRAFKDACDKPDEFIPRKNIEKALRATGYWNDEMDIEYKTLLTELIENEKKILKGGIKASQGKSLAIRNIRIRQELQKLNVEKNRLDNLTIEAQAENAKFDSLVASCTVYLDSGKPYFKSYDDYLSKKDSVAAWNAASNLAGVLYEFDENAETNTTEYKFLRKMKFIDDKNRLINKDGHLVDENGKLIDEFGYYVNEQEERVDINGNKVELFEDNALDTAVFLDEDDKPIVEEKVEAAPVVEVSPE